MVRDDATVSGILGGAVAGLYTGLGYCLFTAATGPGVILFTVGTCAGGATIGGALGSAADSANDMAQSVAEGARIAREAEQEARAWGLCPRRRIE